MRSRRLSNPGGKIGRRTIERLKEGVVSEQDLGGRRPAESDRGGE